MKRARKCFVLFQKRTEPAGPRNSPSQAGGVEDTAGGCYKFGPDCPSSGPQEASDASASPCCWNIRNKGCHCRFLGSTPQEQAGPSPWVGWPKPGDACGRTLSEDDKKQPKRAQGDLRTRGPCWGEVWCYTFPQHTSQEFVPLQQKQNVK